MNLGKTQSDYSVYLPAISGFYISQLHVLTGENAAEYRVPAAFELGNAGLDFLKQKDSYFFYPYGLYSAGHAQLDVEKSKITEGMVQQRNRDETIILGDSGGFQIATGVLKLDWANAKDPNDPARTALCNKILKWLEATADWSMTLDVPAFAATAPLSERTGLTDFNDTLDISILNLDYFLRHRTPGATKFLNVISGTSESTSKKWYDSVKSFSNKAFAKEVYGDENRALEGYAFAGINMKEMSCVLNRLLDLREDNLLHDKDWIHFLGTGKLQWACFLTSIQRQLRKYDNPNITLSFDAASPFVNTAYGQTYSHNYFEPNKFGYFMNRAFDQQELKGSSLPAPFAHSPIMSRLTMGDLCVMSAGDKDRNGKPKSAAGQVVLDKDGEPKLDADGNPVIAEKDSTSWDTQTYLYYMAHSVYNHITAVQEANRLADVEKYRVDLHYKNWHKPTKKANKQYEVSPYVPANILYFDSFVKDVLDPNTPNPRELIKSHKEFLDYISLGGDDDGKKDEVLDTFFDF